MDSLFRFVGRHIWLAGLILVPVIWLEGFVRWVVS